MHSIEATVMRSGSVAVVCATHATATVNWALLSASIFSASASVTVDEAILTDSIPAGSSLCEPAAGSTTSSLGGIFSASTNSEWRPTNSEYESDNFLAEMSHSDADSNRTWTMRIGTGGSVYSLVGAYGEAVPPQDSAHSAWVDDVLNMGVAVDTSLNGANDNPYFVHQAGTYHGTNPWNNKDYDMPYTPSPFYSLNVAGHCEEEECSFASWGQQAHIPVPWTSDTLYLSRYRDCGDGVIESTQLIHNDADMSAGGDTTSYLNTPWGGVRPSSLADVLKSDINGTLSPVSDPIQGWGADGEDIPWLEDGGGFTTFAQNYPITGGRSFDMPCHNGVDSKNHADDDTECTADDYASGYVDLKLTAQSDDSCNNYSQANFEPRSGANCAFIPSGVPHLINTYCKNCENGRGFLFTNDRTG